MPLASVSMMPSSSPTTAVGAGLDTFTLLRRWQGFLEVSGRASENTRRQYMRYVIAFIAETLLELDAVTEDDIVAYLSRQDPRGAMRGMSLRALRSFYRFAEDRDLIARNPVKRLRPARQKYGPAPYLTEEELERVLTAAESIDPRARPTLEFMYATGARIGSMVEIEADDLDWSRSWVTFRVAKNDEPYGVPLGPRAASAAKALIALADYTPRTVNKRRATLVGVGTGTVSAWAKRAGEIAGVRAYSHLMRHTFAERVTNNPEIPDIVAAELLNHRDTSLLRRYGRGRETLKVQAVQGL